MRLRQPCKLILLLALGAALWLAPAGGRAQLIPNLGGQRAGISALQFLKIGVGARGIGLGESFTAIADDASALYWNPAGLTEFTENQVIFAHTEYVVDIKHEFLGFAYHLSPTNAVGIAITSLHTPEFERTTETQPFGTGDFVRFGDVAIGLTYARKMTDQFSFGVTLRYVEETLDMVKMRGVMADLGTYYRTGLGTSRFAIVISNFGSDVTPSGEAPQYAGAPVSTFQSFSPPTLFKIGFAIEPVELEHQKLTTSIELNHPNDNAENVHLGVEYKWNDWLAFRTGLKRTIGERLLGKDESGSADVTLGMGVAAPVAAMRVNVDYGYANFNILGSVHRISVALSY